MNNAELKKYVEDTTYHVIQVRVTTPTLIELKKKCKSTGISLSKTGGATLEKEYNPKYKKRA